MIERKFYNFDIQDNIDELESFYHVMCRKYFDDIPLGRRVVSEAMRANVLAILNERTFSMFNPISDDWEEQWVEMLFGGMLDNEWDMTVVDGYDEKPLIETKGYADRYDVINYIINSKEFKNFQASLKAILHSAINQHHPSFTIWEATIENTLLYVDAVGDYRIEQWHDEHGVVKAADVITVSLEEFRNFVAKLIGYKELPLNVTRRFTKSEYLDNLIQNCVSWLISNSDAGYKGALGAMDQIFDVDQSNQTLERIETYFRLEYSKSIERLTNSRAISQFHIYGSSMTVHFANFSGGKTYDWKEMQNKRHEQNMDYIPSRQR